MGNVVYFDIGRDAGLGKLIDEFPVSWQLINATNLYLPDETLEDGSVINGCLNMKGKKSWLDLDDEFFDIDILGGIPKRIWLKRYDESGVMTTKNKGLVKRIISEGYFGPICIWADYDSGTSSFNVDNEKARVSLVWCDKNFVRHKIRDIVGIMDKIGIKYSDE